MNIRAAALRGLSALFLVIASGAAHAQVDIQKFTNGFDADTAPGPVVSVGSTVSWTYVVTNTGGRELTNIAVTDDQGVTVSCPDTTLDAGTSFTCTATGTAIAGQYVNVGTVTATMSDSSTVSASDPSHYFGQSATSVTLEKRTNGEDADTPPGPSLPVGSTVNWEYIVTNAGAEALQDIVVTDDQGVTVTCPGTTLAVGESMTCTASGVAVPGQYANIGSVSATRSVSLDTVVAVDPSHYYGQFLRMEKFTNGIDVVVPPGPTLAPGSTVTWTYEVQNPGPAPVSGLTITDDQGVLVTCAQTTITAGNTVTCTGTGTVQPGQYTNIATASATLPAGGTITATDTSYYFGNFLSLQKFTNGVDADLPPGPGVAVGSTVNWTYVVTNFSADTFTGVAVTDDQGVTVTCPDTTLAPGASMTCTASGVAVAGQYANIGTAVATGPSGTLTSSDPSHYFGQTAVLDFADAPDPAYPTLFASNGPRHLLASGTLYLGNCIDAEPDGLPSAGADGDDTSVGTATGVCTTPGDDEDGVTFTTQIHPGLTAGANIVASAPCTLSAWIDFNANGDFSDPGDALFPGGTPLVAGINSVIFAVPAGATPGATYSRFRCTTDGPVSFTGEASDGEVEDHAVTIAPAIPALAATKSDALLVDINSNGLAEPGDTLRYTIVITNSGFGAATGVAFNDTPDANTGLVVGSVTTSGGTVTTGNGAGDTTVAVNVGTIGASGGSVTITFDVTIDSPFPAGVTSVSNQGAVSGDNFASLVTDDPTEPGSNDPTVTPITVVPLVTATKSDALFADADSDGIADPGDTLRYTVVITNSGSGAATGVVFNDTPDPNTALFVGSVTTSSGTVTTGNTAGDTTVSVNVGTILAGGSVTITFDVTIDNPFPNNVTTVSNQGSVSGDNFPTVTTDDPAAGGANNPTTTPIGAAAVVEQIPTLHTWSLLLLLATLGLLAARRITS